jgi:hypothetical protein
MPLPAKQRELTMKTRILALALLLAIPSLAYAGRQEAEVMLTRAQGAVAAADRAGAPQEAANEYRTARDTLVRAQGLFERRQWDNSELEAAKAHADARLAEARARQAKAEAAATQMQAAIETLRAEIARQGGRP